jgi:hypothetical protein
MIPIAIDNAKTSNPTANAIANIFNSMAVLTPGASRKAQIPTSAMSAAAAITGELYRRRFTPRTTVTSAK